MYSLIAKILCTTTTFNHTWFVFTLQSFNDVLKCSRFMYNVYKSHVYNINVKYLGLLVIMFLVTVETLF